MIRYALQCSNGHRFEAWFGNSEAFETQRAAAQVTCPECGETQVEKSLMAPGVPKASESVGPREFFNRVRAFRSHVLASTEDVGTDFPAQARQMHEGELDHRPIRGQASRDEVRALREDGVPVAPLPPEPPAEN